jgi:hypothetical protein
MRFSIMTFFSGKKENLGKKYASGKETASVVKILTENGRIQYGPVRYATVLWINSEPLLLFNFMNIFIYKYMFS